MIDPTPAKSTPFDVLFYATWESATHEPSHPGPDPSRGRPLPDAPQVGAGAKAPASAGPAAPVALLTRVHQPIRWGEPTAEQFYEGMAYRPGMYFVTDFGGWVEA